MPSARPIAFVLALSVTCVGGSYANESSFVDYHDVRAIHDAATLRLDRIAIDDQASWALIEILPSARSGGAVAKGMFIDAGTGELVVGPDARLPVVESGRWVRIATLSGELPEAGEYEWEVPEEFTRIHGIADYYSPFTGGGLIVARYDPDRSDAGRFSPLHLIPAAWNSQVLPALRFYQNEKGLFSEDNVTANRQRLRELVTDDNPFIALTALRTLIGARENDLDLGRLALTGPGGLRQASLVYLLLTGESAPDHDGATDRWMLRMIHESRDASDLMGLALGTFAASLQHHDPEALSRQERLFRALSDRNGESEADEYVSAILDVVGADR